MTKENVIKLRRELHHLCAADRDQTDEDGNRTINIPLMIRVNTSYQIDEMSSCVIWDDDNEIVYSIEMNNEPSGPLNTICPMSVHAFPYASIEIIGARLDKLTLDAFLSNMVSLGLTSNAVRKRYFNQMQGIQDETNYLMGDPSKSTTKGGSDYSKDNPILDKEAYKTL